MKIFAPFLGLVLLFPSLGFASELAVAGFMERSDVNASIFGFSSSAVRIAPGVWGTLLLTRDQAEEIRTVWLETWGRRKDENPEPAVAKQLELEFNSRREQILTAEQKQTIRTINPLATEAVQAASESEGKGLDLVLAGEILKEKARAVLAAELIANWESVGTAAP
jgi:citrate lyase gamma subunit